MTGIFLYGDALDKTFGKQIYAAVRRYAPAAYIGGPGLILGNVSDAGLLLIEAKTLPQQLEHGMVLLKPGILPSQCTLHSGNYTVVVASQHKNALKLLKNVKCSVITCGISSYDTLSLSSKDDQHPSVSLQRSIKKRDGSIQEECELPLHFDRHYDEYTALCAAAVLLYCSGEDLLLN